MKAKVSRLAAIGASVLALSCVDVTICRAADSVEAQFSAAQTNIELGNTDSAIQEYQNILTQHPESASKADLQIGYLYLMEGKYAEAIAAFKSGIASLPVNTPKDDFNLQQMKYHLAESYRDSQDWGNAIVSYQQLVADYPDNIAANKMDLAACYMGKGDYDNALVVLNSVKDQYSDKAVEAKRKIAECCAKSGKWDEAIAQYQLLISAAPSDEISSLRQDLADSYMGKGDFDKARTEYNRILANHPEQTLELKFHIAESYKSQMRFAEAIEVLQEGLGSVTNTASADEYCLKASLCALRECYGQIKDWDSAAQVCSNLIALFPQEIDYKFDLASCYMDKKDFARAIPIYTDLAKGTAPEALKAWLNVGYAYQCQDGKSREALAAYQSAVAAAPSNTSKDDLTLKMAKIHIAECYRDLKDYDNSLATFTELADDYPAEAGDFLSHAADGYVASGDYEKAIAVCKDVVAKYPQSSDRALKVIVECLRSHNRQGDALAYLQKAYVENPAAGASILKQKADLYSDENDYGEAISALEQLLTDHPYGPLALDAEARIGNLKVFGLHDTKGARTELQNMILEHPDYNSLVSVANDLAYCSYMEGKYAEAASLFTQTLQYPEIGNYHALVTYLAADCYVHLGDYSKSKEMLDMLLKRYPSDCWAQLARERYTELTTPPVGGASK